MNFIEIEIVLKEPNPWKEVCMAYLGETAVESLEETETGLKAYVAEEAFDRDDIERVLNDLPEGILTDLQFREVQTVNWNEEWEKNFDPVSIGDQFYLRAPFHKPSPAHRFEIVIQPKMSFGTGHHGTTSGILELVSELQLTDKSALDMGCGTAILAIAAYLLGSRDIDAIDIDEWAYTNALENVLLNNCAEIRVIQGDKSAIPDRTYDVIFANINRNILLEDMSSYAVHLEDDGYLYLSGFYQEDLPLIQKEAEKYGLVMERKLNNDRWIAAEFRCAKA